MIIDLLIALVIAGVIGAFIKLWEALEEFVAFLDNKHKK